MIKLLRSKFFLSDVSTFYLFHFNRATGDRRAKMETREREEMM